MNQLTSIWASWVINYRWWVIVATLFLVFSAPSSFDRLYHDNSNESYFLENDPHLESFQGLIEYFGDPEYLLIGIPTRAADTDIFNAETIAMVQALTEFLEEHRHISLVRSLSKYQYTHDDDGLLATDDLFDDVEALSTDEDLLEQARTIIAGETLALGSLITPDFKHTRIVARMVYLPGENYHNVELLNELRQFIAERGFSEQGFALHLSGAPVIGERFETLTQQDMAWINPVMGVLMIGILYIIFRSVFATLVPLIVIVSTMVLVTSLQGFLAWPFTAVNSALIPTVIVLCMGACVHVLVEFFQFRSKGYEPKLAAKMTIDDLLMAVLFTCLTTTIGFLALSVTDLVPVRQFAILAAIAPMLIFLLSMTSLPVVLSFISWLPKNSQAFSVSPHQAPPNQTLPDSSSPSFVTRITQKLPEFTYTHRRTIAVAGFVVTLFSAYGVTKITVDTNVVNYFKDNSWVNQDLQYFNQTFNGISHLEVIIDAGEEGGVKSPAFLSRVDQLQQWLTGLEETGEPTSVIKFYKQIQQALNEDDPAYFRLPESREMAAQFLLLYENTGPEEDLSDLKDFGERYLRISTPVVNMNATKMTELLARIKQGIDDNFSDLHLDLTGSLVMNNAQNNYVNNGMFYSFSIAIFVIGLCFIVLFRSFKYGVIALVPSIVPVLLTGGIISMAGIPLDLGTMIVGAMTIGIAVDDSIHLMSRYLLVRKRGHSVKDSISSAINSSGRAVILTSIILITGFSVMLLGSFVSYIYVGLFSAMIMLLALMGDLIFMPAVLFLVDGKNEKEVLVKAAILECESV